MLQRTIDKKVIQHRSIVIEQNRHVVYVAMKAIKYLATEMMALRGHTSSDGKFLHLFELLAEFDPGAAAYLQKLRNVREQDGRKKPSVNLISPLNVRRLLLEMKKQVTEHIINDVRQQGVCSVIYDGTQDESKMETQCVLLRYVETDEADVPRQLNVSLKHLQQVTLQAILCVRS